MIELQQFRGLFLIINVKDDPVIVDYRDIRIVNARKCIIAFRKLFFCTGSCDDLAAENNDRSVCPRMGSETKAVQKIGARICDRKINGFLRTGHNDRFPVILDQIRKCRRCIRHRIRPVTDDKSIIILILFLNQFRQCNPVFRTHIRTVERKRRFRIDRTEFSRSRNILQKLIRRDLRRKSLFRIFGCNGSTCRYQKYFFHPIPPNAMPRISTRIHTGT